MPAYNFRKRFAPLIRSGKKHTTIRKNRKYPTRVGDFLFLYTGMRTSVCELLGIVRCTSVMQISIIPEFRAVILDESIELSAADITSLARLDGLESADEFFEFFAGKYSPDVLAMRMEIIEWYPLQP